MHRFRLQKWFQRGGTCLLPIATMNFGSDTSCESETDEYVSLGRRRTTQNLHLSNSQHVSKGRRYSLEDTCFTSPDSRFSAVFDGHGGTDVSLYLSKRMHPELQRILEKQGNFLGLVGHEGKDIRKALHDTFIQIDKEVERKDIWDHEGSTATVVYLEATRLWTAHVGDSRAVLSRRGQAIPLTKDHKPEDPDERSRVEEAGGYIEWFGALDNYGNPLPGGGVYRVNENLSMTRAIGDKLEKPCIIAEPTVNSIERDIAGDQFVVIASDGLWDVMDNHGAVEFVNQRLEAAIKSGNSGVQMDKIRDGMARSLVEEAFRKGSADNIAVVIVWLQ